MAPGAQCTRRKHRRSGGLLETPHSFSVLFTFNWSLIMNSFVSMKNLGPRLILISAAIFINANTVHATDRIGDAQSQAQDLLAGTVGGKTKSIDKSLAISADQRSYPDPQTQARQLLLGTPSYGGVATRKLSVQSKTPPMSARTDGSAHTDPQELARRMILDAGVSRKESAGMRLSGVQGANR
jgi:hypothetical protein